jgi:hypothetical protein
VQEYLFSFASGKRIGGFMAMMTEEEAWALEKEVMQNPPKVSGDGKSGLFMKHKGNLAIVVDDLSAAWLRARANALHKSTSEIIGDLVREKIAVTA